MWTTKGQWLHMKTTTLGPPAITSSRPITRPLTVSGSWKSGAVKPRGIAVVGVRAMDQSGVAFKVGVAPVPLVPLVATFQTDHLVPIPIGVGPRAHWAKRVFFHAAGHGITSTESGRLLLLTGTLHGGFIDEAELEQRFDDLEILGEAIRGVRFCRANGLNWWSPGFAFFFSRYSGSGRWPVSAKLLAEQPRRPRGNRWTGIPRNRTPAMCG